MIQAKGVFLCCLGVQGLYRYFQIVNSTNLGWELEILGGFEAYISAVNGFELSF
jgi:uncharacterized membrane protein